MNRVTSVWGGSHQWVEGKKERIKTTWPLHRQPGPLHQKCINTPLHTPKSSPFHFMPTHKHGFMQHPTHTSHRTHTSSVTTWYKPITHDTCFHRHFSISKSKLGNEISLETLLSNVSNASIATAITQGLNRPLTLIIVYLLNSANIC